MPCSKKILISAGEASGDLHAAKLISDIKKIDESICFYGMGGALMRRHGAKIIVDINKLAVVGIVDVILQLPKIWSAFKKIQQFIRIEKPGLLVLVDYPGFNLRLAKFAKKHNVKVLYYISPKLWASRPGRAKSIKKYVDKMAVIFPFEVDFFRQYGIEATFVGNPLVAEAHNTISAAVAKKNFNLSEKGKIIGLFPGSRKSEIKKLLPVMIESAYLIRNEYADCQFILPLASTIEMHEIQKYLSDDLQISIVQENIYDLINVCDAIVVASGTATLQVALMGKPMIIVYKIFPPYFPIKALINVKWIGLCNIISGKEIVKELLQQHANANKISAEIIKILSDNKYARNISYELLQVRNKLLAAIDKEVADMVLEILQ